MRASRTYLKIELLRRGVPQSAIAEEAEVDRSLVSHVIAGRRRHDRVEQIIAEKLGAPVDTLFAPRKTETAVA